MYNDKILVYLILKRLQYSIGNLDLQKVQNLTDLITFLLKHRDFNDFKRFKIEYKFIYRKKYYCVCLDKSDFHKDYSIC